MDRRSALRNIAYITVGSVVLPACVQNQDRVSTDLKNIMITGSQEKMLADLAQSILPSLNGTGAKELQSHLFALMMIDDCFPQEEQANFMKRLKNFEETVKARFNSSFSVCNQEQKNEFLKDLENKKNVSEDALTFYETIKKLTVQSYTSSRDYMEKIAGYKMIPGKYKGCVPVNQA